MYRCVGTPLPSIRSLRPRCVLQQTLFLIAIATMALACGLWVSHQIGVAVFAAAAGLSISTVAILAFWAVPSPTRIVPVGISPAFGQRLTGASLIVGRKPCCDVVLPLPTVSGHHCRFHRSGRAWYIEDLASCNGTLVNQRPVQRKRLRIGDLVSIGEFQFTVE